MLLIPDLSLFMQFKGNISTSGYVRFLFVLLFVICIVTFVTVLTITMPFLTAKLTVFLDYGTLKLMQILGDYLYD
jgi:hypothetical protein